MIFHFHVRGGSQLFGEPWLFIFKSKTQKSVCVYMCLSKNVCVGVGGSGDFSADGLHFKIVGQDGHFPGAPQMPEKRPTSILTGIWMVGTKEDLDPSLHFTHFQLISLLSILPSTS